MSDPVKSVEVEDVLSSIRRLVSEDNRPVEGSKVEPAAAQDRLVLTPALRVMDHPEAQDMSSIVDPWSDTAEDDVATDDVAEDDDHAEAPFVAMDAEEASFKDPLFKDQPMSAFAEFVQDDADALDSDPDEAAMAEMVVPDAADSAAPFNLNDPVTLSEFEPENEPTDEMPVSPFVEAEANFEDEDEDVLSALIKDQNAAEAEITVVEDNETTANDEIAEVQPDLEVAEFGDAQEPEAEHVVEAELIEPEASMGHSAQAASLSSKIAALEAVIGGRDDQWDPDNAGDSDYSGTEAPTMDWDEAETETAEAAPAPETNEFVDVADVLDEETLREMVSDIVREELQGALGERITRNVRKLVRREIHRAMAAQELE